MDETRAVNRIGIMLLLAAASAACIPMHPTVREARRGAIVDARTRAPVAGATVRVESYRVSTPPGYGGGVELVDSLNVATDASGQWSVPREHEWTIGMLVADGLPLYADVYCVFADGYADAVRNPHDSWFERQPPTAGNANDREIEAVLLLERRDQPPSNQTGGSPGAKRSCIAQAAAPGPSGP
jgi:hypothetical protein